MLSRMNVSANLAVKDIAKARDFYENTLGLEVVDTQGDELIVCRSGGTVLNIYRSDYAGTNQATAVTWVVGSELENIVTALKERGVVFERYEMPEMTRRGDIHAAGNFLIAWFKDPDGNILSLASG